MLQSKFSRSLSLDAGITEVSKGIYWIGVNDWDLREFHSMHAPIGTSYNSYIIKCEKPTIIDPVKAAFSNQWISRLQSMFGKDLKGVENIVVQHAEPDHTSALPVLAERFPHIKILATKQNMNTLSRFYNTKGWNFKEVKLGQEIDLGSKKLVMAGVPMAHWPESAVTYLKDEKILFSSDAFGQHIASTKRFFDEIDSATYVKQAKEYYANILLRLQRPVLKALKTAGSLPGINMVLPAHGVGLRRAEDIAAGIKLYSDWANQKPSAKVSILYDCNWFGTEKMAVAIASGAAKAGNVDVKMLHARKTHITNVATEFVDTAAAAIGSSTLHESILPDLAMHLNYLKCLQIKNKVGAIFGTYGWNKNAVPAEIRNQLLVPTKTPEIAEPVLALWNPGYDDLKKCEELGMKLGAAAIEKANKK